jgi:hypothetical protein
VTSPVHTADVFGPAGDSARVAATPTAEATTAPADPDRLEPSPDPSPAEHTDDPDPTGTPSTPDPDNQFPSAAQCAPFTPAELPSGADPGEPVTMPDDQTPWHEPVEWQEVFGERRDRVAVARGQEVLNEWSDGDGVREWEETWAVRVEHWGPEHVVTKDGVERMVHPPAERWKN